MGSLLKCLRYYCKFKSYGFIDTIVLQYIYFSCDLNSEKDDIFMEDKIKVTSNFVCVNSDDKKPFYSKVALSDR